jgi:glycine betaine/proline transport system permease protein
MIELDIGGAFEALVNWLQIHFSPFFDALRAVIGGVISGLETALLFFPSYVVIGGFVLLAGWFVSRRTALFALVGLALLEEIRVTLFGTTVVVGMDLWTATMQTLALVLTATLLALLVGIPVGIAAAKRDMVERAVRPILDFMQTMPAFVYLIPAVLLFGLGEVPGVIATFIFATPPAVRLTNLGIRQVADDVVEAARAFGSTPRQVLLKVELPLALPTILAGVNQTIMLALSMVVIAALIGAGGLGDPVVIGITQLQTDVGFEGGLAIVILAIVLDRLTQGIGAEAGSGEVTAPTA